MAKKKKPTTATSITRKAKKRYEFVEFESELFDGVFRLPRITQISLKRIKQVNADPSAIVGFLEDAEVDQEAIEAVSSLSGDELAGFMDEWSDGATILPKSLD